MPINAKLKEKQGKLKEKAKNYAAKKFFHVDIIEAVATDWCDVDKDDDDEHRTKVDPNDPHRPVVTCCWCAVSLQASWPT